MAAAGSGASRAPATQDALATGTRAPQGCPRNWHRRPLDARTTASAGFNDCPTNLANTPGHGSYGSGTSPITLRLQLLGSDVSEWDSNESVYQLLITASTAFRGIVVAAFQGDASAVTTFASAPIAGSMALPSGETALRSMSNCAGGFTHVSGGTTKTSVRLAWTPPASGTGTVTFFAITVQCVSGRDGADASGVAAGR